MKQLIKKALKKLTLCNVQCSTLRLPKDQKLVDKIVYELNVNHNMRMQAELNVNHNMRMQADPNEEGFAIGIIEEVLKYYA